MQDLLSRIGQFLKATAHSTLDKVEDPAAIMDQAMRELRQNLIVAVQDLAQIRAIAGNLQAKADQAALKSGDYERKAVLLLDQAKRGGLSGAEATDLATEALVLKQKWDAQREEYMASHAQQQGLQRELEAKVEAIKDKLDDYQREVSTLKARMHTASAVKRLNEQMAGLNDRGIEGTLERMRERVGMEEALAKGYEQISLSSSSVDARIDEALGNQVSRDARLAVEELKARLGMNAPKPLEGGAKS